MPSLKVGLELLLFPVRSNDQNLRVKVIPLVVMGDWEVWDERQLMMFQSKAFLHLHQLNVIRAH